MFYLSDNRGWCQIVGPRPDLDPDIVAALDDALDLDDPDNILDDDFILQVLVKSVYMLWSLFVIYFVKTKIPLVYSLGGRVALWLAWLYSGLHIVFFGKILIGYVYI